MDLKVAYSPTLALAESWVALYQIYVLKDPLSAEIFYVGQTRNDLKTRLSGHLAESRANNPGKRAIFDKIIANGEKPVIESIESISGTCYLDSLFVNDREIFWIKFYKSRGVKLTNIASSHNDAECRDFKNYLKSIKAGQTSYHYYYCGKTYGGHKVYDESKMKVDGFKLPEFEPELPRVQIVEKIVERLIYPSERPEVQSFQIPKHPEQPSWTESFAKEIPFDNWDELVFDFEEDDSDWEIDSDLESEEESDEGDCEPDAYDETDELEKDDPINENHSEVVISVNRQIPFYLSKELT
jgi:hypothetical protein